MILSAIIKDGNDEWKFKSIYHGTKYIAINDNSDAHEQGILISEKSVDNILEAIDSIFN